MSRLRTPLDPLLRSRPAERLVLAALRAWASAVAGSRPDAALRRLLPVLDNLAARVDMLAIELDGGVHAKHRLTGYHDFFVDRIREGEKVLDIGCGKGELASDIATRSGARVTAIDVNRASLDFARHGPGGDRLELVHADALEWEPPHPFDVVILSNVLEHIGPRVELLRRLDRSAQPDRFLIRVPSVERDWSVPLRADLGLPHYGDPTHETEYTEPALRGELADAGLELRELIVRWGELWAVAGRAQGAGLS